MEFVFVFIVAERADFPYFAHSHSGRTPNLPTLTLPRLKNQCQLFRKKICPRACFSHLFIVQPKPFQSFCTSAATTAFTDLSSCIISDFIPLPSFTTLCPVWLIQILLSNASINNCKGKNIWIALHFYSNFNFDLFLFQNQSLHYSDCCYYYATQRYWYANLKAT